MTAEEKSNPAQKRPITLCPWLVILGALLLYGFTLNHWVTLGNLPIVSQVTGWDWHPFPLAWRQSQVAPLFFVLTYPIRALPSAWEPAALNAFATVCAALALGLLAASVRLLPQDRTKDQRQREGGEFALLSVRAAFLPALFAVLMMGLQLTFWHDAISVTGDMLDLLVFAFLIFCLLKFRISQNDNWLAGFVFVYGLGTTNNWALIGFFPLFFIALVWIKGVNFFNWRFLARMAGCGVLGLLLYLLIPAIGSLGHERANFWSLLHMELGGQTFGLRQVPRWIAMMAALPTLLPLIFAGICWPSFEGELSASGHALTRLMFRVLHVVFLALALSMFFDLKYSSSQRLKDVPQVGFLTFYYMGALCIGYFSGYILLVYGKTPPQSWDRRGPLITIFNRLIVGLLWLLAVAAPGKLLYDNIPHISAGKNNGLIDFSEETLRDLPAKPVVILSDDPEQLYLLEAAFRREGKPNNNILIETTSLPHREYIAYLVSRYPELKKVTSPPEGLASVLPSKSLIQYLYVLGRSYPVYYLHPSFGYYFEVFYLKPHGLVYQLQTYPKDVLEPPPLTSQEIKENQDAWARVEKKSMADLPSMGKLDQDTAMANRILSVALNYWGVSLQKAGYLQEANAKFAEAVQIHPQNFIAKINKQYNENLQKNDHRPIDTGDLVYKAVNLYRGLVPILKFNGPADEPGLILDFGSMMADGQDYRQAAILFGRRLQLLPGDINAELDLAKTYVDWGLSDKALGLVQKLRANPAASRWEVSRVEALAYYAKNDFPTAEKILVDALQEDPQDENRVSILAEFYRKSAYTAMRDANVALREKKTALHEQDMTEATRRFNNALTYLNQELQSLMLASHGSTEPYGVAETLLKKAEVEMMLKSFDSGIATLTKVIDRQPNNPTAFLNRAIAEVQVNKTQAAKADYEKLRKLMPQQQMYVIDYGLADIAAREKDRAEEIRCLKHYLADAPETSAEYRQVKQRLKKLEGP
jgi:tetratricopeptide (TPR) repeat protein